MVSPGPLQCPCGWLAGCSPWSCFHLVLFFSISDPRGTPEGDTSLFLSRLSTVWKGFINMQSVAKFVTKAYPVSGGFDHLSEVRTEGCAVGPAQTVGVASVEPCHGSALQAAVCWQWCRRAESPARGRGAGDLSSQAVTELSRSRECRQQALAPLAWSQSREYLHWVSRKKMHCWRWSLSELLSCRSLSQAPGFRWLSPLGLSQPALGLVSFACGSCHWLLTQSTFCLGLARHNSHWWEDCAQDGLGLRRQAEVLSLQGMCL